MSRDLLGHQREPRTVFGSFPDLQDGKAQLSSIATNLKCGAMKSRGGRSWTTQNTVVVVFGLGGCLMSAQSTLSCCVAHLKLPIS